MNKFQSRLKPGLEIQEGNRSSGLHSRIYMYYDGIMIKQQSSLEPRLTFGGREKRAWYTLSVHASKFPEILGIRIFVYYQSVNVNLDPRTCLKIVCVGCNLG